MAWYKRYKMPFGSYNNNYMLYIYMQQDGVVTELQAASEPFVTKEDNSTDLITPIRKQTGTIRVYDPDGFTLANLMPETSVERMVQLVRGTYSGDTFTDGDICWQGFIKAGAYTQAWEGGYDVVEIPVISMLAALDYVRMSTSGGLGIARFAKYIVEAYSALGVTPWTQVSVISDLDEATSMFGIVRGLKRNWITTETVQDNDGQHVEVEGATWGEVLSDVMSLFGMQLRESGQTLYAVQYDYVSGFELKRYDYTWNAWTWIAEGVSITGYSGSVPYSSFLSEADFAGTGHRLSFEPGKQKARVVLKLDDKQDPVITIPDTPDNQQGVVRIPVGDNLYLAVQEHQPRTGGTETHWFYEVDGTTHQAIAQSDYYTCIQHSGIYRPYDNPYTDGGSLYTGCFPVRWALQSGQGQSGLLSGLWMVQSFNARTMDPRYPLAMYTIESAYTEYFDNGFLDIQATLYSLWIKGTTEVVLINAKNQYDTTWIHVLFVSIQIGNYVWDNVNQQWVIPSINQSAKDYAWELGFDGEKTSTNVTDYTPVREAVGWLIPVENMSGKVTFWIWNYCDVYNGGVNVTSAFNHLLRDLRIDYRPTSTLSDSSRSENVYAQVIGDGQENEDAEVELKIGTDNNNVSSIQFIREDSSLANRTSLNYNGYGGGVVGQRPESHLLARLAQHYNQTRRSMTAIVDDNLDIFGTLYTYGGRTFYAVDSNHEWWDDKQEITLIES